MRGERAIQGRLGGIGQLVVDDDRHVELRGDVEDLAERRAVRVAIDQAPADLAHVDLADQPRLSPVELELELTRRALGGRIGQGQAGDDAIRVLLARRRQPGRVFLLQAADAEEHHFQDVVAFHRRDVRVDRGGVRHVRVGVDQRTAVVGAPGRRRRQPHGHQEARECAHDPAPGAHQMIPSRVST